MVVNLKLSQRIKRNDIPSLFSCSYYVNICDVPTPTVSKSTRRNVFLPPMSNLVDLCSSSDPSHV